ncbi:GNAT family N-acetyltransferase [Sphingomonas sp. RHCKR7]|uniref:GNAT family N-acetyltransferase n=1 Tax=Sphingomonas folli TaxID=2862497 RepID=UPI001C675116|nr:GNAT family N-acetyltransferase [Sphingomonas folli]MBW6525740.1 GNAT family N-acetyltransferase [Sphingomonas folli]
MIVTERLILRPAEPRDRAALHAMWADPRVMADLGPVKDAAASDAAIARHAGYRADDGVGFCVVERRDAGDAIGFCGLKPGAPTTPIRGELEIGWMLAHAAWGRGYAHEAAAAWLDWAWAHRTEPRVVAITAAGNAASRRLMARLGLRRLADGDFDHPDFAADDPRRATVTYAIDRAR